MKVVVRCRSCGQGFLVEEAGGAGMPCPSCGGAVSAEQAPAAAASTPSTSPQTPIRPVPSPGTSTAPASAISEGESTVEEMVCPRCGLHFIPRKGKPAKAEGERRNVLVVEDMDYFQKIARNALEPYFNVKTARSLDQARAVLSGGGIDLILLDLSLEGGDNGIQLLQELPNKTCPIVIFTDEEESVMYGDAWKQLEELGADDVVIKTMNVGEALLRKVSSLLGEPTDDEHPMA